MRLGVIGSGGVGRALAEAFASRGHEVTVGSRSPDDQDLTVWGGTAGVAVADPATTAAQAEIVFVATAWEGTENALSLAGADNLTGKVLVDVTNPLVFTDRLELAIGHDDSAGEQVQRWAPGALVVKAFNTVGLELFDNPSLSGGPGTMFIAGDSAEAKATVTELIGQLGWEVHDCGDIRAARYTEPMAIIEIEHAMRSGTRRHAFKLLTDSP